MTFSYDTHIICLSRSDLVSGVRIVETNIQTSPGMHLRMPIRSSSLSFPSDPSLAIRSDIYRWLAHNTPDWKPRFDPLPTLADPIRRHRLFLIFSQEVDLVAFTFTWGEVMTPELVWNL